jgi:hypothetical protein
MFDESEYLRVASPSGLRTQARDASPIGDGNPGSTLSFCDSIFKKQKRNIRYPTAEF